MNISFERGSSAIPATEAPKIPAMIAAVGAGTGLVLDGFASEDEPAALATARATAVGAALAAAAPPHTGARTLRNQAALGQGIIEYRTRRKVDVQTRAPMAPPPPPRAPASRTRPCGTALSTARPRALFLLTRAIGALVAPRSAAVNGLLSDLFGGASGVAAAGTIKANLAHLHHHIDVEIGPPGTVECHTERDAGCVNPAFNVGSGPGAVMTLCPKFLDNPGAINTNAATLIHEGAHGTTGLATVDLAYGHTRLIQALSTAQSLTNTDSYVLLVQNIDAAIASTPSIPIGVAGDSQAGIPTPGEQAGGKKGPRPHREVADPGVPGRLQPVRHGRGDTSGGRLDRCHRRLRSANDAPAGGLVPRDGSGRRGAVRLADHHRPAETRGNLRSIHGNANRHVESGSHHDAGADGAGRLGTGSWQQRVADGSVLRTRVACPGAPSHRASGGGPPGHQRGQAGVVRRGGRCHPRTPRARSVTASVVNHGQMPFQASPPWCLSPMGTSLHLVAADLDREDVRHAAFGSGGPGQVDESTPVPLDHVSGLSAGSARLLVAGAAAGSGIPVVLELTEGGTVEAQTSLPVTGELVRWPRPLRIGDHAVAVWEEYSDDGTAVAMCRVPPDGILGVARHRFPEFGDQTAIAAVDHGIVIARVEPRSREVVVCLLDQDLRTVSTPSSWGRRRRGGSLASRWRRGGCVDPSSTSHKPSVVLAGPEFSQPDPHRCRGRRANDHRRPSPRRVEKLRGRALPHGCARGSPRPAGRDDAGPRGATWLLARGGHDGRSNRRDPDGSGLARSTKRRCGDRSMAGFRRLDPSRSRRCADQNRAVS